MSKYIKNISGASKAYQSQVIEDASYYQIQAIEEIAWANDSTLLSDIGSGDVLVATDNSGSNDITDVNDAINHLKGTVASVVEIAQQSESLPFAAKVLPDSGGKLFKRDTGESFAVGIGSTNCDHTITYNIAKITGVEIIGAELGDYCDFEVYDTPTGAITYAMTGTAVPDAKLNQFGFSVYMAKDFYKRMCQYDADIIKDMKIRIVYNSISAKTVYVNYVIHEVV